MKFKRPSRKQRTPWRWASVLTGCLSVSALSAADTNTPPAAAKEPPKAPKPLTPEQMFEGGSESYNNWIDLGVGGYLDGGNRRQLQQRQQSWGTAFGGIEDFHYQKDVAKDTPLTINGRALPDSKDYKLNIGLLRENLGYFRVSYDQFSTWYNGDGGYFRPLGAYYPASGDALTLDRGEISVEGGLTLEKKPRITFKYTHAYRDGEKDSTKWAPTHPGGALTQNLGPSYYSIDEHRDMFQIDGTHHIKNTDVGLGFRYENGRLHDDLKINQFPGEVINQKITSREGTTYDLFNIHSFTETWFNKKLMLSTGLSYTDLDNDFSGSRIYGTDFDVNYVPNAANGFGYYGLDGGSRLHEYVMDINLMTIPAPNLTLVPSVRVMSEDTDTDFDAMETLGANPATPIGGHSDRGVLDVRERLDATYTGITNWVLYARAEVTEGEGDLKELGGLAAVNGFGVGPVSRKTEDSRLFQKYSAGARWYPLRKLSIDTGGYYKLNSYDYDNSVDNTPNNGANRYPAYLSMQDFETYDGNCRVTVRPLANLSFVTRYEYQLSMIHTKPDSISGLAEVDSSRMTSHIIAEDVTWTPWSRLYLQAGVNYVYSETKTPSSEVTAAILNARNNYWTVNFSSGFVVDDKSDLNLGYFYYRADDYSNNSPIGVPLGAGAEEHGVTATFIRRLTQNLRLSVRYGFTHYDDSTYGGNRDFYAHLIYTTLRYRF